MTKIKDQSKVLNLGSGIWVLFWLLFFAFWLSSYSLALLAPPKRIVSAMPSITEMLYAIGLEGRIVGVTTNCNYPPQAKKKPKVGGFFLNLEKVVSLKPDLIVMLKEAQKRDVAKFRRFGLPVYEINPQSVKGVMSAIIDLGVITGNRKQAKKVINKMQQRLAKVKVGFKDLLNRKKVLVIVGIKPLIVAGSGTYIDDLLKYAGVENIGAQVRGAYPQLSLEKLVAENPDCLIMPRGLVKLKKIKADARWSEIKAVSRGKVLFVDADLLSRPGPRVVNLVESIASFVHQ